MTTQDKITDAKLRILSVNDAIQAGKTSKADIAEYQQHLDGAQVSIMSDNAEESDIAMEIAVLHSALGKLNATRFALAYSAPCSLGEAYSKLNITR